MQQEITFEKQKKLSMSGQAKIAEILRKEGSRNINFNVSEVEEPDKSSGERGGENGTGGNPESS